MWSDRLSELLALPRGRQLTALQEMRGVILRRWCLDQVDLAYVRRDSRDVYELDAARWADLILRSGARNVTHRYTDEWNVCRQYVFG